MSKATSNEWSSRSRDLSAKLHSELTLSNSNWHKYKNNHKRRAAELISSSIVQLINEGTPSDIEEVLEQSLRWLRKEIKAPPCPDHISKPIS